MLTSKESAKPIAFKEGAVRTKNKTYRHPCLQLEKLEIFMSRCTDGRLCPQYLKNGLTDLKFDLAFAVTLKLQRRQELLLNLSFENTVKVITFRDPKPR